LDSADFKETPPKLVIWEVPLRYLTDPAIWAAQGIQPTPQAPLESAKAAGGASNG
jgi:hypothetical protein